MHKKILVFSSMISLALLFAACQKDAENNGQDMTELRVNMTDAPFDATEVNVDIQQVRVNFSDDSTGGWVDLNTHAGVYNLLGLQNGVDTLLAVGMVPVNTLKEIRFVLGTNNSITIDNTVYPLTIPSGSESGLKIKVNKQLHANLDSLLIDFDAGLSVIQTGSGEFHLKPVLKIK